MKTIISSIALTVLVPISVAARNIYSIRAATNTMFASSAYSDVIINTNLVVYGPPYGTNPPANFPEMVKTNGLECYLIVRNEDITRCEVYVFNHTTNYGMACLRMPATNVCQIALCDQQGRPVNKTAAGMRFGLPLSQELIDFDFGLRHWNIARRQSPWLNLYPNGMPDAPEIPTEICNLSLKEVFDIRKPGEYEFHLKMRLVQTGQDGSGKLHYPITWLPEVFTKVQITPEDIQ